MLFGVAHLVSYISQFMTLESGDVISTGTPPGVGLGQKPPRYLRAGQPDHAPRHYRAGGSAAADGERNARTALRLTAEQLGDKQEYANSVDFFNLPRL
jgi:2-keto-4-pentenoate hydratase/2-oxohepta-3-ene-1,7-dioic acid hydratase in catechol pathway